MPLLVNTRGIGIAAWALKLRAAFLPKYQKLFCCAMRFVHSANKLHIIKNDLVKLLAEDYDVFKRH